MSKKRKEPVKKEKVKVEFPGITPNAWEHPADRAALNALRQVPGFDVLLKTFFGAVSERSLRLLFLATAVRVNEKQFPKVYAMLLESCRILDCQKVPELYVVQTPVFNASAVGMDDPFIVIHSGLVETLDDDELLGVVAHELGHIMSGHALYKTLLVFLMQISTLFVSIPLSSLVLQGIIVAFKEWDRKSELSADRAGLLVTQDPEVSMNLLMKMAGGKQTGQMNLGEFIKQAEEYQKGGSLIDQVYKVLNLLGQTHPFPVLRLLELMKWVQSGDYDSILRGFYSKEETEFTDDMKDAAKSYKQDFEEAYEPIKRNLDDISQKAKDMFGQMFDQGNQN